MKIAYDIDIHEWAIDMCNCVDNFIDVVGVTNNDGDKLYMATLDGRIIAGRCNVPVPDNDREMIETLLGLVG